MSAAPDEEEGTRGEAFSRRLVLVGLGQALGFGLIGSRLYQLQVTDQSRYHVLSESNRITTQLLAPARGRILDRAGQVLVTGEEAFRATFLPSLARDPREVLELFARIVPLSHDEILHLMARAGRQRPNVPIILASALSFEQVAQINLLAPRLPGVETEPAALRRYPTGRVTGHVVGYVGHVADVAIDDDPILALPWMRAGKTGLERGMDTHLRGRSGRLRLEVDARGHIVRSVGREEPVDGGDIVTTLDLGLQRRALLRLQGERRAAAVVMDVEHGEVLVMASVPTYDPGPLVDGLDDEAWRKLAEAADDPLVNRTISGQYPPGSTFKMVTALAALEAGTVTPRQQVRCSGHYRLFDQTYRCWNRGGHGPMDMVAALRESCDVYFYELARRTGIDRIAAMARRLGFGQTFACGLDLQKRGLIPGPDWKIGRFGRRWVAGETVHAGIGQGYVLATPLQMAVMAARIATGKAVTPTLVAHPRAAPANADLGIDRAALDVVRRGMQACVHDGGGTGWRARFEDRDTLIAGKTGTSQVTRASARRDGTELAWSQRDHALFVAYAPAAAPRYAIATVIEHGGSGGTAAAPLARDILAMVLDADPASRPAHVPAAAARSTGVAPIVFPPHMGGQG